jgi:DNA-binding phage protein
MPRKKPLWPLKGEVTATALRSNQRLAEAFLREAIQALIAGDDAVARALIRDVIKGTIGYAKLSKRTGTPETSLVRMFGPKGNPTAANLCNVLAQLQAKNRVRFEVRMVRAPGARTRPRARAQSRRAA